MRLQPTFRRLVFTIVLLVTLAFGWWPFNFAPRNDVQWDREAGALRFNPRYELGSDAARGLAFSAEALDTRDWSELSILVELTGRPRPGGLGVFLEVYENDADPMPALSVAQWQDHLAIRSRRDEGVVARGYAEIGHRDSFAGDTSIQLLLASNSQRTAVYVDGDLVESRGGYSLIGADNRFVGKLVFGNSADGASPFTGEIKRVAIFDSKTRPSELESGFAMPVVEYRFATAGGDGSNVVVPASFTPLKRSFMNPIDLSRWSDSHVRRDMLVNTFGFIPVGLCFAAAFRRRLRSGVAVLLVVAFASFSLSFLIELGQGYLVHRDSSQLDLLLNTLGGSLAAFLPRRLTLFL